MKNVHRQPIAPDGWSDRFTYVPAVRVGNVVYFSGTTGTDESGCIVEGGMAAQTRHIFMKFDALLKTLGGSCDDIVSTTDFIVTTHEYSQTAGVRREFFRSRLPTSTGVIVAGLLRKGALIEVSAVAVLGESEG